jgi:hypothetical protein
MITNAVITSIISMIQKVGQEAVIEREGAEATKGVDQLLVTLHIRQLPQKEVEDIIKRVSGKEATLKTARRKAGSQLRRKKSAKCRLDLQKPGCLPLFK